ncbi:MAG TPA: hypothetical protein VNA04_14575 [Thermoanaerobaculia bacterium]|nr:hypothetical protein [Thermoanaerobaculia bacterium]
MKAITLRNIPPEVERAIRAKARQKRISTNKAVIELLVERVGVAPGKEKTTYTDLDDLAGSWSARKARDFERTLRMIRRIDEDLWR